MADPTGLSEEELASRALEPGSFASGDQSHSDRPVGDLIKLDQYLAAKRRGKRSGLGFSLTKVLPPAAGSDRAVPPFDGGV